MIDPSSVSTPDKRTPAESGRWSPRFLTFALATGLFAITYLAALLVKRLNATLPILGGDGSLMLFPEYRATWEAIAVMIGCVIALYAPRFGRRAFRAAARAFSGFASHKRTAILAAAMFPAIIRVALLPVIPIPKPWVPDEFGHLLVADTIASGRLANPTHPMWHLFETLYVVHQPTYASQYPIAQGLLLALPVALHLDPWYGVLLSTALMCAALCWMLQGWVPPKWALLGALLAGARWGVVSSWINSYWGGAAGAIGGALLLGALARLLHPRQAKSQIWPAALAGLGIFVLAESRPFEGFLLSLPLALMVMPRLLSKPRENIRALATLTWVCALAGFSILFYNWRVTGKPLEMPYQLDQQIYGTPQNLLWSTPVEGASRAKVQADIWENFKWQLGMFEDQSSWPGFFTATSDKLASFWGFFFQPILTLPLLFLPRLFRDHRIRALFAIAIFVLLAILLLYPFFFPHYVSPLTGLFLLLMIQGARCMRAVRRPHKLFGRGLFRWSVLTAGVVSTSSLVLGGMFCPACVSTGVTPRSRIADELTRRGGKHLVLVRYTPSHNFHNSWIYNAADIDASPIIWARESDPAGTTELLNRYRDRDAWLVNADDPNFEPILYADKDKPRITEIYNSAGKSPFFKAGVAPGSIAAIVIADPTAPSYAKSGNCLISPAREADSAQSRVLLDDFDGSRPGQKIASVEERMPAIMMQADSTASAGIFSARNNTWNLENPPAADALNVTFAGIAAKVMCAAGSGGSARVTVLVPPDLSGDFVDVVVRSGANESKPQRLPLLTVNPGILEQTQAGKKSGLLLHSNGALVDADSPAHPGEVLSMFMTGFGAPGPQGTRFPFVVGVNNRGAPLRAINCLACRSGIVELRFEVPRDTPPGNDIPLSASVAVNGKQSYSNNTSFAVGN